MHAAQVRVGTVLWAVVMTVVVVGTAQAADRFVSTAGSDTANDCLVSTAPCQSLAYAITQAASGDTIMLAAGTYQEGQITIDSSVTLAVEGGWTSDFTQRDPRSSATVIDQPDSSELGGAVSIVAVVADVSEVIDVTFDDLTLQKRGTYNAVSVESLTGGSVTLSFSNVAIVGRKVFGTDTRGPRRPYGINVFGHGSVDLSLAASTIEGHYIGIAARSYTDAVSIGIANSTITHNSDNAPYGSGMQFESSGGTLSLVMTDSLVTGNIGRARYPGGIRAEARGSSVLDIEVRNSTFSKNRTMAFQGLGAGGGGGMYLQSEESARLTARLTNCALVANHTPTPSGGGGLAVVGRSSEPLSIALTNTTVSRNTAGGGGGIFVRGPNATIDLLNTILWGNRAHSGNDLLTVEPVTVNADHSDIGEHLMLTAATYNDLGGNVDVDPELRITLTAAPLHASSPMIDAGTCTGAPTTDFEGDPRPTGASCDIGADEFVP